MNAADISLTLLGVLEVLGICEPDDRLEIKEFDDKGTLVNCLVETFGDRGLRTSQDGFILTLCDGSEFKVTVVRTN